MHFEDKFEINASLDKVWSFITDPREFVKVIPDLQRQEIIDERRFSIEFKMGLGMIKGTVKMNMEFKELRPKAYIKLVGKGSGLQSTADLSIMLNLSTSDGKTLVNWSADLNVAGTVMSVGSRFIEPTTKSKVIEIVQGIKREVEKAG
ncbi:MAG: carbon monoxide dehydrogenase subunit G [Conexivisphaerales archaeon]